MAMYTITLTTAEDALFKHLVGDPQDWLNHAVRQKLVNLEKRWVDHNSKFQAKKLTRTERRKLIRDRLAPQTSTEDPTPHR